MSYPPSLMHVPLVPSEKSYKLDKPFNMLGAELSNKRIAFGTGSVTVGAKVVGDAVGDVGVEVGDVVGDVGDDVGDVVGDVGAEVIEYTNEYKSLLGEPVPMPVRISRVQ
mmetsp:Transcript_41359/g.79093  ORF Transcript_41359/g.79093 Transcript_41359/m.79093 type:complete len:110 (-) Transcript_41359:181-510(-)